MNIFALAIGISAIIFLGSVVLHRIGLSMVRIADPKLYEEIGSPQLIGHYWSWWPTNKRYDEWLSRLKIGDVDRKAYICLRASQGLWLIFVALWLVAMFAGAVT
jgi:hypothetical protein